MRSERTRINRGEKGSPWDVAGMDDSPFLPSPSRPTRNARRSEVKNPRTRHSRVRPSLETLRPRTKLRVDPPYDPSLLLNLPCNFRSSSTGPACVSPFHYTVFALPLLLLLLLLLFRLIIRCHSRCTQESRRRHSGSVVRSKRWRREKERRSSLSSTLFPR